MRIARVKILTGHICGGASGVHSIDETGFYCKEVRGIVESVQMQLQEDDAILTIVLHGNEYKIKGTGIPRIDVDEEVILSLDGHVQAVQILKGGDVMFRFQMPDDKFRHGSLHYRFE